VGTGTGKRHPRRIDVTPTTYQLHSYRASGMTALSCFGELIDNCIGAKARSIDIVISPQTVTIGSLLAHVRRGDVVRVHSLRRGSAEALETVVHGPADRSRVVGRKVQDIALPDGSSISAVVRGERVIIAHHDTVIEEDDHVIMFLVDPRQIDAVERIFQVE
jgi:trk system potassium uptake protein TrkA